MIVGIRSLRSLSNIILFGNLLNLSLHQLFCLYKYLLMTIKQE